MSCPYGLRALPKTASGACVAGLLFGAPTAPAARRAAAGEPTRLTRPTGIGAARLRPSPRVCHALSPRPALRRATPSQLGWSDCSPCARSPALACRLVEAPLARLARPAVVAGPRACVGLVHEDDLRAFSRPAGHGIRACSPKGCSDATAASGTGPRAGGCPAPRFFALCSILFDCPAVTLLQCAPGPFGRRQREQRAEGSSPPKAYRTPCGMSVASGQRPLRRAPEASKGWLRFSSQLEGRRQGGGLLWAGTRLHAPTPARACSRPALRQAWSTP